MRKHRLPIGWPRRDPRHYRFPLPNAVWEYKLKPIEFVILSYLCCQHFHGGTNLSPEMIAKGVHLTLGTVKKYLSSLVSKGLITNGWSLTPAFQRTGDKKFFTLPNEIFLLNLPSSAFMVYAYLLLIEDRRTHTCHPSYNTIAAETGITKNTAIWPDGKKHARNVYAHSEAECEKLLAEMIAEVKAEIAAEKERLKTTPKAG